MDPASFSADRFRTADAAQFKKSTSSSAGRHRDAIRRNSQNQKGTTP